MDSEPSDHSMTISEVSRILEGLGGPGVTTAQDLISLGVLLERTRPGSMNVSPLEIKDPTIRKAWELPIGYTVHRYLSDLRASGSAVSEIPFLWSSLSVPCVLNIEKLLDEYDAWVTALLSREQTRMGLVHDVGWASERETGLYVNARPFEGLSTSKSSGHSPVKRSRKIPRLIIYYPVAKEGIDIDRLKEDLSKRFEKWTFALVETGIPGGTKSLLIFIEGIKEVFVLRVIKDILLLRLHPCDLSGVRLLPGFFSCRSTFSVKQLTEFTKGRLAGDLYSSYFLAAKVSDPNSLSPPMKRPRPETPSEAGSQQATQPSAQMQSESFERYLAQCIIPDYTDSMSLTPEEQGARYVEIVHGILRDCSIPLSKATKTHAWALAYTMCQHGWPSTLYNTCSTQTLVSPFLARHFHELKMDTLVRRDYKIELVSLPRNIADEPYTKVIKDLNNSDILQEYILTYNGLATFLRNLNQIVKTRKPPTETRAACCLLSGPPGIGKSKLLEVLRKSYNGYYMKPVAGFITPPSLGASSHLLILDELTASSLTKGLDIGSLNNLLTSDQPQSFNQKYGPLMTIRGPVGLIMATNQSVQEFCSELGPANTGFIDRMTAISLERGGYLLPPRLLNVTLNEHLAYHTSWHFSDLKKAVGLFKSYLDACTRASDEVVIPEVLPDLSDFSSEAEKRLFINKIYDLVLAEWGNPHATAFTVATAQKNHLPVGTLTEIVEASSLSGVSIKRVRLDRIWPPILKPPSQPSTMLALPRARSSNTKGTETRHVTAPMIVGVEGGGLSALIPNRGSYVYARSSEVNLVNTAKNPGSLENYIPHFNGQKIPSLIPLYLRSGMRNPSAVVGEVGPGVRTIGTQVCLELDPLELSKERDLFYATGVIIDAGIPIQSSFVIQLAPTIQAFIPIDQRVSEAPSPSIKITACGDVSLFVSQRVTTQLERGEFTSYASPCLTDPKFSLFYTAEDVCSGRFKTYITYRSKQLASDNRADLYSIRSRRAPYHGYTIQEIYKALATCSSCRARSSACTSSSSGELVCIRCRLRVDNMTIDQLLEKYDLPLPFLFVPALYSHPSFFPTPRRPMTPLEVEHLKIIDSIIKKREPLVDKLTRLQVTIPVIDSPPMIPYVRRWLDRAADLLSSTTDPSRTEWGEECRVILREGAALISNHVDDQLAPWASQRESDEDRDDPVLPDIVSSPGSFEDSPTNMIAASCPEGEADTRREESISEPPSSPREHAGFTDLFDEVEDLDF